MKRLGVVGFITGLIVSATFGLMAAAYGLGGLLEKVFFEQFGIVGGSGVSAMLVLMLVFVMVIATLLTLAERKWSALMQDRIGPNRARINLPGIRNQSLAGLPHIATDVVKMLTKEDFQPQAANKFLFNLAPMLAFAPAFALFAVVPAGPTLPVLGYQVQMAVANPDFGLLYIFAIASLAVYGTSLAGWASNNKFALLGGVRASSQMISYEVALGLSLVGMMIAFSTVRLAGVDGMAELQGGYLWHFTTAGGFDIGVPAWGFLLQPLGFVLFFAAAFAETKRAPFDTPEGESEIIGYFVEYSGMKFGLFMIAEFVEVVVLAGVIVAIFFGGYYLPFGNEWLKSREIFVENPWLLGAVFGMVFWLKVVALCYVQLAIRWTFPRFRYDQIQTLGWKILLPVGLVNVFVTGAVVLAAIPAGAEQLPSAALIPYLKPLAIVGLIEIAIVIALTLTPRERTAAEHGHDHHGHGDSHGHSGAHSGHAPVASSASASAH